GRGASIPAPGPSAAAVWPSPAGSWSGPGRRSPTARSTSAAPVDRRTVPPGNDHEGGPPMAGWGDDPELEELRRLIYEDGWEPIRATIGTGPQAADTVVVRKDQETKSITSDHIAFHRFVEGLREDNPNLPL